MKIRLWFGVLGLALMAGGARADLAPENLPLEAYLVKPEPEYRWEPAPDGKYPAGRNETNLLMVSQKWQGVEWKHRVQISEPQEVPDTPVIRDAAVIWVTMGEGTAMESLLAQSVARATGALGVNLYNVPNQPLFGKSEDALIAQTIQKAAETKDLTWPLLLPMTKSVIKAMDAVSEWSMEKRGTPIRRFILMAASKRGWTCMLAAENDRRVIGVVPMVFNFTNMGAQLDYQKRTWGGVSDAMTDYRPLLESDDPEVKAALSGVDPMKRIQRLTMPKLFVLATNDRYWPVEGLQFYEKELPKPWSLCIVPNAGHTLSNGYLPALLSAGAWMRRLLSGEPIPSVQLHAEVQGDLLAFKMTVKGNVEEVRSAKLWYTTTASQDRRDAKWMDRPMDEAEPDVFVVTLPTPLKGITAAFGEFEIGDSRLPLRLSTPLWQSVP